MFNEDEPQGEATSCDPRQALQVLHGVWKEQCEPHEDKNEAFERLLIFLEHNPIFVVPQDQIMFWLGLALGSLCLQGEQQSQKSMRVINGKEKAEWQNE